jgi:biotin operon repressor
MTREIHFCRECGTSYGVEEHHIVFRSENKNLEKCKLNFAYLCQEHHRGTFGVHGSKGSKLNRKLKLEFQNTLELLWDKKYLTREEINEVLQISEKALNRLLKTLSLQKGLYVREEVIRICMGNKLILEEDSNERD